MTTTLEPQAVDARDVLAADGYAMRVIRYQAKRLVKRRVIAESEQEDIEQELSLRLLKRLPNFTPKRARLNTFVAYAVRCEAQEIKRLRQAEKQVHNRKTRSLDDAAVEANGRKSTVGDRTTRSQQVRGAGRTTQDDQRQSDLRLDLETVMSTLPPELRESCQKLLQSNGRAAIPPAHSARLRKHFEAAGLRDYL